jgi:UDP-glucuronate 4-epimerase
MKSKNILVTGAAGFIGYHLCNRLHQRGDRVLGVDNFNDYYTPQLKHDRAKELARKDIAIIDGDVSRFSFLKELADQYEITHVVHLAAQAGVRYSLVNPQAYVQSNISGFLNILELCRHYPHMRLTYASSSSVYGTNTKIPFSVEDRTDSQASFYGVTKKTNELMAHTYHHLYKIPTVGLRFFTVYGPWGRPDMAYFSFTKAILEGSPIDVYNHGHMKRDFTYVDDIIDGTVAAIDLEAECEIFNLGNHQSEPLLLMIELLEKNLGKKAKLNHLPMQLGDVETTYADISYSHQKLGFSPKVSLEEGIPRFVKWYQNYFL